MGYYRVSALNGAGEGSRSAEVYAAPGSTQLPGPTLTATPGNGQIALHWSLVTGALSYNIYSNLNNLWQMIAQTAGTAYTNIGLTNGVAYTYIVQGVSKYGQGSSSNQVTATAGDTPLRAPQLAATGSESAVTLTWTNVAGAYYYNLYRSTATGQEKLFIRAISPTSGVITQYSDTSLADSTAYYYKIVAVSFQGEQGTFSNEASATPPNSGNSTFLLSATPERLTIARSNDDVVTIGIAPVNDFTGSVTLSGKGLPSGVTAGFYPAIATTSGSLLTISVDASATPGIYTLTIKGVSGSLTQTMPVVLTILASPFSNIIHAQPSELPDGMGMFPRPRRARLPASGLGRVSLLNDIGLLGHPVDAATVAGWGAELAARPADPARVAQLHLWLGEYALGHDEQPRRAMHELHLASADPSLRGLAAYDTAFALFYEGAYADSADAFAALTAPHSHLTGFDVKAAMMWHRMALAHAGYHASHAAKGIPEPPRLDPECGVAALAACLQHLGLPSGRALLVSASHVTGEGNDLADLVAAGTKLGVRVHTVIADDKGLMLLPKPLIAHVEHDHFIAVIAAGLKGVSYLCSDCGLWPGGRVDLTWAQWHLLSASHFGVVTRPGDAWDRALGAQTAGGDPGSLQVATAGLIPSLGVKGTELDVLMHAVRQGHVTLDWGGVRIGCGSPPAAPGPPPAGQPPDDDPCLPPDDDPCDDSGPQCGDPVNLATGEEEYTPKPDMRVYNPSGPSVVWGRIYDSLRGDFSAYEFNDFGGGWSQPYNVGVYDPSGGNTTGTKYLFYPNGARVSFTASAVPSSGTPRVACTVAAGNPLLVEWDYAPNLADGYFTITRADRTRWVTTSYDSNCACFLLAQIVDRNGNAIKMNYGQPAASGSWPLLASISDPSHGRTLLTVKRTNDGTGSIASVTDIYGRSVIYHVGYYPTQNLPSRYPQFYQLVDHAGQITTAHAVTATDRWNYGYSLVANGEGTEAYPFMTSITVPSPSGTGLSTAAINYTGGNGAVSSLVDANGNTRTYQPVDAYGTPDVDGTFTKVTITNASGNVDYKYTVGYDDNMSMTSRKTTAGTTYTAAFSDANDPYRPSSTTDADGRITTYTWDAFGNPLSRKSPRGTVTTNTLDYSQFGLGEIVKTKTGNKSATTFTYYEPSGLLRTITRPAPGTAASTSTVTTTLTYDALGNPTQIAAPGNNAASTITTTLDYSADGSYSQTDSIGQPLTITDNLGHITHFRYDARGNRTVTVDASGNETDQTYNIANQPQQTILPATGQTGSGHSTITDTYLYPNGPRTSVTVKDESGAQIRQTLYGRGLEGELLSVSGSMEPFSRTYDGLYRVKTLADGDGHVTAYAYNAAGFPATISYPGAAGAMSGKDTVSIPSYDKLGNPLKRIDGRGVETDYLYNDAENKPTDIKYLAHGSLNVHLTYDAYGRRATMTDGSGAQAYTYDDDDLLLADKTTYTGLTAQTIEYTYYADGSRKTITTPAGTSDYAYDGAERLTGLTNPYSESTAWGYYDNGWLTGRTLANGVTEMRGYDGRSDLLSLVNTASDGTVLSSFTGMKYDGVGNRTAVTAGDATASAAAGLTTYAYDTRDQLTQEKSARSGGYTNNFIYDEAGNPTTFRSAASNTFNTDNQITSFSGSSGASLGRFAYDGNGNPTTYKGGAFTYDAENRATSLGGVLTAGYTGDGLRAWKQHGSTKTYFLYDGIQPICELNSSGAVTAYNTFGPDGLISRWSASATTFYTFDPQGNVVQRLTASATVASTSMFDAFGANASALPDPFGFGAKYGYYTDTETGLTLCGLRYYDATTGRWLNRDPIGYQGGINIFAYVGNNPLKWTDSLGLDLQSQGNNTSSGLGSGSYDPNASIIYPDWPAQLNPSTDMTTYYDPTVSGGTGLSPAQCKALKKEVEQQAVKQSGKYAAELALGSEFATRFNPFFNFFVTVLWANPAY